LNLKACNNFRLYNGKAAEAELKVLDEIPVSTQRTKSADLVKHNIVVFRSGENAQQVLPPLIGSIPEAQLNLVIHHLRSDEIDEAFELVKDIEPSSPQVFF